MSKHFNRDGYSSDKVEFNQTTNTFESRCINHLLAQMVAEIVHCCSILLFIRLSVSLIAFTILHSYSVKFLAFWQDSLGGNSRTVMIGNLSFLSL